MFDDEELGIGLRVTLKDVFSAAATKIEGAWGRLQARLRGGGQAPTLLQRGLDGVKGAAERLNRALSGTNTLLPSFGTLVRTAGSMLRDLIGHAIRSGSEIENLELAFTTMLGGADAARAHLEELQRFAIGKPFEFAQLASASRLLQTFGFQARDVTGLLTDFGDAAFTANTGFEGVERMSRVFGQIRATGKTTVGHLNMLVRSGVPAYDILRERLGLTGEELQKIARSGIPAERVITALREGMRARFSGGLDRAAATLSAKLSDLQDLAGLFYRTLYRELGPYIVWFIDKLSSALTGNMTGITRTVKTTVATILGVGRILVGVLGGAFSDVRGRWERDSRGATRSVTQTLERFAWTIEGVAALVSSDNGRGLAQVPRGLQRNLVDRGLWPTVVAMARFFNRLRALVGGFVEGLARGFNDGARRIRVVTDALGLTQAGMTMTRAEATRLGERLGRLVTILAMVKAATLAVRAAGLITLPVLRLLGPTRDPTTGRFVAGNAASLAQALGRQLLATGRALPGVLAQTRIGMERLAGVSLRFALANPVLTAVALAVVAIGLASLWAYRHADQLASSSPKWRALRVALNLVFGPFIELAVLLGRTDGSFERFRGRVVAGAQSLWRALYPLRVAVALIVLAWYVVQARVAMALAWMVGALARAAVWIGGMVGRAALAIGRYLTAPFVALFGWIRAHVGVFAAIARVLFAPFLFAARFAFGLVLGVLRAVGGFLERRFGLHLAGARLALVLLVGAIRTSFTSLPNLLLAPLRLVAREIVSMYRGLPAALQPSGLEGAARTLETFAQGPATPAQAGAVVDTQAAGAGAVTAANVARTTGVMAAAQTPAAVVVNAPPPPPPGPTIVQIDGREVARAVDRQNTTTALRGGRTVETE